MTGTQRRNFIVTVARFHRKNPDIYVLQGYFEGNSIAGSRMSAQMGSTSLKLEVSVREGLAVRQKYFSRGIGYEDIDREYDLWITLPRGPWQTLRVYQELDGKKKCVYRIRAGRLKKEKTLPDGYLETFHDTDGMISIGGWAVGSSPCRIQVLGPGRQKIPSEVSWHYRPDIAENYPDLKPPEPSVDDPGEHDGEFGRFGYEITFKKPEASKVSLIVAADGQRTAYGINLNKGLKGIQGRGLSVLKKGAAYLRRYGFVRTCRRVIEKLSEKLSGREEEYMAWRKRHLPSREELQAQEKNVFLHQPLVSVAVPLYRTPEPYLKELVSSLKKQTYRNWELCLSDGSGEDSPLTALLDRLAADDPRIRVIDLHQRLGISENTNAALSIAKGEYIAFCDHDDVLPPFALYEVVRAANEHPDAELIYSDEDKISPDSKKYFQPHFKTDFNIDLLCSMNYICHLTVVKRSLAERAGGLDPAFDGAQDYDYILRCAEMAEEICHIPKVLYHWRAHPDSTAENPESKRYAFEAGQRAVQAHYDRCGIDAKVIMGEYPGLYRTIWSMGPGRPLISIIIPNKDHVSDLDKCVKSIMNGASYTNYEFVIVENNSTQESTFAYYKEMEEQYDHFRVITWEGPFNYSEINNLGVKAAKGEYLLFLNNDTELISPDLLEQLAGPCQRSEVGVVGARLYYGDDTIQHAGVIIGYGGIAGHAFGGFPRSANGYFSRIICMSDLSAVTAACMMVKRSVFEEAGGFDGTLKVAFNDVDLCLRIRKAGYLVVYNPYAEMYHYESKSRGYEDTPEKIARFNKEADDFLHRWPDILQNGDPYYNPNLSLDCNDFGLKK